MKQTIKLDTYTIDEINRFIGHRDENIELLESAFETEIILRGDELLLQDEEEKIANIKNVIEALLKLVKGGKAISKRDIMYALNLSQTNNLEAMDELYHIKIARSMTGKLIYPKTLGQRKYYFALKNNDVVFGIWTSRGQEKHIWQLFLLSKIKNNEVKRIVLTRPAVEAGENLGFLPGHSSRKRLTHI